MDLLAILYHVVEVHRSDETFGDELSECIEAVNSGVNSSVWSGFGSTITYCFVQPHFRAEGQVSNQISTQEGMYAVFPIANARLCYCCGRPSWLV
jgi:hypothetical protein